MRTAKKIRTEKDSVVPTIDTYDATPPPPDQPPTT